MKNSPNSWKLKNLIDHCNNGPKTNIGDKWLPARPLGDYSFRTRLKYAWKVFKGECDVLEWPEKRKIK